MRYLGAFLALCFMALPLSAQVWEVYDHFDGPLNPALWFTEYGEDRSALEYGRQIRNGYLELLMRSYGRTDFNDGKTQAQNMMAIVDWTSFKGMKVQLTVTKAMIDDALGGQSGILIRASFYNSGSGEPIDDVGANIGISAPETNSQTLSVGGEVVCGAVPGGLGGAVLGSIKIGEPVYIWVRWDTQVKKFFFGLQSLRRNQPPVEQGVACALLDVSPPVDHVYPMIGLSSWLSNSMTYQASSELMVKIDQVSVLR